jgi:hypothetical protein
LPDAVQQLAHEPNPFGLFVQFSPLACRQNLPPARGADPRREAVQHATHLGECESACPREAKHSQPQGSITIIAALAADPGWLGQDANSLPVADGRRRNAAFGGKIANRHEDSLT